MSEPIHKYERIIKAIQAEPWAITEAGFSQILAIVEGFGDPEALSAKLGRPLENTRKVQVRDGVALIPVTGPVFRYANLLTEISGATSLETLATDFAAARDNPKVTHIVQVMDTPGGMVSGISEYARLVRAAHAVKPVYAYVGNLAASAGYWMAAAAGQIVVADTAGLGSVGVVLQGKKNAETGTWEIVSQQSPKKRLDPTTPEGKAEYQGGIDYLAQIFIEALAEYRGISAEKVLADFGQGGLLIGRQAVEAGMADRVGTLENLIAELSAGASSGKIFQGASMSTPNPNPTKESLAAEYPALYQAVRDEGYQAGTQAERERIQSVEAQTMPGHETLIAALKFDGKTTGPEAAVKVLAAEKEKLGTMQANLRKDAPAPAAPAAPADAETATAHAAKPVEERAKATWDKDPGIRAEFPTYKAYEAYMKAIENGGVRVLVNRKT